MEKFLHPMFVFDVLLPMGAGMAFCFWMLWDLRKENKAAEARKAALAALQSHGGGTGRGRSQLRRCLRQRAEWGGRGTPDGRARRICPAAHIDSVTSFQRTHVRRSQAFVG